MQANRNEIQKQCATTVRPSCSPQSAGDDRPESHLGIDDVLSLRVGCWRPPVYVSPNVSSPKQRAAHGGTVRIQRRRSERQVTRELV